MSALFSIIVNNLFAILWQNCCSFCQADICLKSHRSSHHRCSAKKLLLKILQYSQENTSFFNKVAGLHNFLDTH